MNKLQRNIKVLVVEPYKLPYEKIIPNNLQSKQAEVGGNIEYVYMKDTEDACLICNEEGKLYGMPLNRDIGYDIIAGTFLVVADNPEIGEDRSLTDEQIEKYKNRFGIESIRETELAVFKIQQATKEYEL